jgi:hypothetical protein
VEGRGGERRGEGGRGNYKDVAVDAALLFFDRMLLNACSVQRTEHADPWSRPLFYEVRTVNGSIAPVRSVGRERVS